MNLRDIRRMASEIMKCGINRVWIDPNRLEDMEMGVTRGDVRRLIVSKAIVKRPEIGVSRVRAIVRDKQRSKGRRRGHGKREGTAYARFPRKRRWIQTIRPIRRRLRELKKDSRIDVRTYRTLYRLAKGGVFKSTTHLNSYIQMKGYVKEEEKK